MNSAIIKVGLLGRKVEFTFNLAALKSATAAIYMDLGEFYTSEKINDETRFFYLSYGAWLNGRNTHPKLLMRYAKMYKKFTTEQLHEIKQAQKASDIMSEELQKAISAKSEKKN
jgi:hypothetical protein